MTSDGLQQCKRGIGPPTNHALFFPGFLCPILFGTLTCTPIYLHPLSKNYLDPISSFKKIVFLFLLSGLRYHQFCLILCLFSLSAPHSITKNFPLTSLLWNYYWSGMTLLSVSMSLSEYRNINSRFHVIIRVSKLCQQSPCHYQSIVTLSATFSCRYHSIVTLSADSISLSDYLNLTSRLHVIIRV